MSDKLNGKTTHKHVYDSPRVLVLYADALPLVDVTAIAAIATKNNAALELGSRNRFELAAIAHTTPRAVHTLLFDTSARDDARFSLTDAGGDAVAIAGNLTHIRAAAAELANPTTPVVAVLDVGDDGTVEGGDLETAIQTLDERAETRPWHYVLRARSIAAVESALGTLFRSQPGLAHRVVGVIAAAGVPLSAELGRELLECAKTFGVTFLGAAAYDRAFYETLASA